MEIVGDAKYGIDPVSFGDADIRSALLDASETRGLALINFRNFNQIEGLKFTLPEELAQKFEPLFFLSTEGTFQAVSADDKEFNLPQTRVSSLLLRTKGKEPFVPVLSFVFPHQTEKGMFYEVQMLNLTTNPQDAMLKILDGSKMVGKNAFTIPAHGQIAERIQSPVQDEFTKRLTCEFAVKEKTLQRIRRTYDPFFHDPSFEKISNRSADAARTGKYSLKIDAGKRYEPFITLPPKQDVTVSVYVKKGDGGVKNAVVNVYNHQQRKTYLRVIPAGEADKDGWVKYSGTFRNEEDSHIRIGFANPNEKGSLYFDQVEVKFQ